MVPTMVMLPSPSTAMPLPHSSALPPISLLLLSVPLAANLATRISRGARRRTARKVNRPAFACHVGVSVEHGDGQIPLRNRCRRGKWCTPARRVR